MKELAHLNKYFLKYKHLLLLGLLFIIISNIFQILPAQYVRYALDLVIDNINVYKLFEGNTIQEEYNENIKRSVVVYGLIILGMALLRGFFLFLVRQTIIVMSRQIEYDLKNEIYEQYQSLPLSFYRRNNTGDLLARISEDVSKVRMYIGPAIMYGLNLFTLFIMLIPIMFAINFKLTLFALLPLPFLSFSIYYVHNKINRRSEEIQRSLSGLSTFVQEAFSGIRVLKSFAREQESAERFSQKSEEYKLKSLRLTRVNALFFPLILFLIGLSIVITVFVGGSEVINGTLSFGNIAEFIIYINLLTWPVTSLGWITSIVQRAAASQKRINEFLQEKNQIQSFKNLTREIQGDIKFEEVYFTYEDSGINALKDISFEVKKGRTLAIIGTTGSGKSTIANLICRLFDPSRGKILMDGTDLGDFNIQCIRSQIGYVPQDVFLFSDTIDSNIAFGSENLDDERIIQAAIDADLHENIIDLPDGFNTVLGERGITLSGGQKQRLSIARALVRNPRILILDDSLSAVDTKTENNILNNLQDIMKGRTSIIISHRVSSAKLADQIIVLDNGRIIEQGNHDSLIDKAGVYKELYEKQLKSDEIVEEE
ncbi:MAG: ABC transporter ATP-binding protein [Cyclobacteriaceae bacterium]